MVAILEASQISKTYGKGELEVAAVKDASFRVESGELVVLMGPSGSGKTTLMLMCGGLLTPDRGAVLVDGVEISGKREDQLPSMRLGRIGFVFQQFNLLEEFSAAENVEIVLNAAGIKGEGAHSRVEALLGSVGVLARAKHYPFQLSGGEKQRVALARALANNPRLLLADEPTGNLDSKSGGEVVQLMRKIVKSEGRAALVATHDPRIHNVADRILHLEDGRLAQS